MPMPNRVRQALTVITALGTLACHAPLVSTPEAAELPGADTSLWQPSGREFFADLARLDSAVARSLFRSLQRGDLRFLNVSDYGDGAIGMWGASDDSLVARFGSRLYADAELMDERVRQQRYFDPYQFADIYNTDLRNFVVAPDSQRACFLSGHSPYGGCWWSPLRATPQPPRERTPVAVDSGTLIRMLDAVLRLAVSYASRGVPIDLDARLGWDGTYRLARRGWHPGRWVDAALERGQVSCASQLTPPLPCPARGPLTTIQMNIPRYAADGAIVVHVLITTVRTQDPRKDCGWGCFYGSEFDAHILPDGGNFTATAGVVAWIN